MTKFRNTLICPYCENQMNDMEINIPSIDIIEDEMSEIDLAYCTECWKEIKVEVCYTCEFYWYNN